MVVVEALSMDTRAVEQPDSPIVARPRSQAGESLIEVLATITIVSICVIGLVASLGMNFVFSSSNHVAQHGHQVLLRYAESIAAEPYQPCSGGGGTPYSAAGVNDIPQTNLPDGIQVGAPGTVSAAPTSFELSISSVKYWNGDSVPATFTATCPGSDPGFQQLVLLAHAGDGSYDERITLWKRVP